jgi:mRNA interferase RelE/StbE
MTYEIIWSPRAKKFLRKLPRDIAQRIILKAKLLEESPLQYLEHLSSQTLYKLRVGEYRLLVDMDFILRIVRIQVVGHRRNIYKRIIIPGSSQ